MLAGQCDRRRSGFSMLEVIAIVAVMAILGAVVIPALFAGSDARAVVSTKRTLDSLQAGYVRFGTIVGSYPGYIHLLSDSALSEAAPLEETTCSVSPTTISGASADNYRQTTAGPFFQRIMSSAGGLPVGIGIIDDAIPKRGGISTTTFPLFFQIRRVTVSDGQALNDSTDGVAEADNADGSNTLGNIRYPIPSAEGTYTVVQFRYTGTNRC